MTLAHTSAIQYKIEPWANSVFIRNLSCFHLQATLKKKEAKKKKQKKKRAKQQQNIKCEIKKCIPIVPANIR